MWKAITNIFYIIFTSFMGAIRAKSHGQLKSENERLSLQNEILKKMASVDASGIDDPCDRL